MASGNAVIATDVGGLPNLIIPGHNGLLIKPEVDDLRHALETLIRDEGLRRRLAEKAVDAARSFNLEDWKGKWSKVLQANLPQQPHRETRKGKPPSLTVIIDNAVSQRSSARHEEGRGFQFLSRQEPRCSGDGGAVVTNDDELATYSDNQ
jgi:hypothetical protein